MGDRRLLDEQLAYYRARAREYDEWFLRQGRYDRGAQHREGGLREIEEIETALHSTVHGAEDSNSRAEQVYGPADLPKATCEF
jgi:hypothetical protein